MNRFLKPLAAAVCLLALPAAADAEQTVKVNLLDMTALMGPGFAGGGYGAMGQGMMGAYGGRGYGQGMMGGGGGYGMMGPGGGYGGGYGPGGAGMMGGGMMSIRTDHASVPSGKVSFDVTNLSRSVVHEMLVVAVDSPDSPLPYDYNSGRVAEDQVKVIGETQEMQPNAEKTVEFNLPAGTYLLICNVPGHFAAGMVTPLTVTP